MYVLENAIKRGEIEMSQTIKQHVTNRRFEMLSI